MSGDGLRPRPGPAPRLVLGTSRGDRSLYSQHVLDEDTYTDALSHIIQRDFFPELPHLHATNDYLSALASNDPQRLGSSIRRLARLAADKEDKGSAAKAKASEKATPKGKGKGKEERRPAEERERDADSRRREFDAANTPYMSVGARGWDTPPSEGYEDDDWAARGPSKRRRTSPGPADSPPRIRDDLTLDAFQRNYTSEDNASFAKIVDVENARRREEKSWAWAAEQVAADKRIEGEERRKLILDAATNGEWRVDAHGRRLIGGLAQGASADAEGEAWRERKMITAGDGSSESSGALVKSSGSSAGAGALIKSTSASSASALPPPAVEERPLPPDHPLARALTTAGLPPTALVSTADGAVVPQREAVGGHGDGRGRGSGERAVRATAERGALADEEALPNDIQQWEYKAMNNLMFLPNANEAPYPKPKAASASSSSAKPLANKPTIAYRNTRLADDEEEGYAASTVTSSPARSMIDAAVRGQEYIPRDQREPKYSLLSADADPDPEDLPPLMTWGTLLATPKRLEDESIGADDGPAFRLPERKRRDELGRKLGSKASRAIADRARAYAPTPGRTSRTPSLPDSLRSRRDAAAMPPPGTPRAGSLTPAARSLLDRSMGRTPRGGSGLGLGLGSGGTARGAAMEKGSAWARGGLGGKSWTPSPAPRR